MNVLLEIANPDNRRGMRDILALEGGDVLKSAGAAILDSDSPFVIGTGFPVNGRPETDGPPGALAIINGLTKLGKKATFASYAAVTDFVRAQFPKIDCRDVEINVDLAASAGHIPRCEFIAVEICGLTVDGTYRSMRRNDISAACPKFEADFGRHALIAIGDGGNEFGMGSAPSAFFRQWDIARPVSTSQHLIPSAVSNFGCYALLAELSIQSGEFLLPDVDNEIALLRRMVSWGFVDGFSGEQTEKVDGEPLENSATVLRALGRRVKEATRR